ncbi:hypothetical protein PC116_g11487 [Phytophthora cactorum]|nr:hypothetical protein PC114_g8988 [Phytophthora cactorum]KAG3023859.1 hypothetical protein PC120_g7340 [Phytophthora cactorum]KAG4240550.1 hypothetical protein PC116_g11487 [Phytophthora cactorum]
MENQFSERNAVTPKTGAELHARLRPAEPIPVNQRFDRGAPTRSPHHANLSTASPAPRNRMSLSPIPPA